MITEEKNMERAGGEIPDDVLEDLIIQHSHGILMELIRRNPELLEPVEDIAMEYLKDIDEDDMKNELFCLLDWIRIEDVWDNSGGTRDGYVDPDDLAWEMFEEELKPFLKEAMRFHDLDLLQQRDACFRGILGGAIPV